MRVDGGTRGTSLVYRSREEKSNVYGGFKLHIDVLGFRTIVNWVYFNERVFPSRE
jgi:hypothetical protein